MQAGLNASISMQGSICELLSQLSCMLSSSWLECDRLSAEQISKELVHGSALNCVVCVHDGWSPARVPHTASRIAVPPEAVSLSMAVHGAVDQADAVSAVCRMTELSPIGSFATLKASCPLSDAG